MSLTHGDAIEIDIDALSAGGDGVGRHRGRVVFVPRTAPGDRIRARIARTRRRHAHAEPIEILRGGSGRRMPSCGAYEECGGCSWMHLSEEAQRAGHLRIVRDAFERIARIGPPDEIERLASPVRFGYRSRARVAADGCSVGFRARRSSRVVDVSRCPVLDADTQAELTRFRALSPTARGEFTIRGYGEKVQVGDRVMDVGPDAFMQANRPLWTSWQERVAERCGRGGCLVELYAGVGFYTVRLTQRFGRVVAVERGEAAESARRNTSAHVVRAAAEDWAPAHLHAQRPDVVLVNPPRTGCHPAVLRAVRAAAPRRLVYVSCDPPTLARDVGRLSDTFRVECVDLIDALPQTHHVEVICVLELQ